VDVQGGMTVWLDFQVDHVSSDTLSPSCVYEHSASLWSVLLPSCLYYFCSNLSLLIVNGTLGFWVNWEVEFSNQGRRKSTENLEWGHV
jgi:hypothetical protein